MNCVITGAAAGIGRALATRLTTDGHSIVGVDVDVEASARTRAELQNKGADVSFLNADLATEDGVNSVAAELAGRPPIDVLIHNAGINHLAPFAASNLDQQRKIVQVNLLAPILLTTQLLRTNRLADSGSLVFVASLSHFVSYPGAAVYAASKDGLVSYAKSLSVALRPRHISVLTVFPGPTRTEHARRHSPDNHREHRRMPPEKLANLICRSIRRRRRILVPGFSNKLVHATAHFFPRFAERQIRKAIFQKI